MTVSDTEVHVTTFETGMGSVTLASTSRGVLACSLPGCGDAAVRRWIDRRSPEAVVIEGAGRNAAAVRAVQDFLAGQRDDLDLPLDVRGTPFQLQVWSTLRNVGYGETLTYAELARRSGHPRAVRAVGAANGANPLPLFVPCHRVVASDGGLGGFGGGLPLKRRLLDLEAQAASGDAQRA